MKHIFLLEDDETLGRGIVMALTGPEASVMCRSTLAQAWEALAEEPAREALEKLGKDAPEQERRGRPERAPSFERPDRQQVQAGGQPP